MPKFFKMLDLSTSHLTEDLALALNKFPGVIADERTFGWLLWVPEDIDEQVAEYEAQDPEHTIPEVIVNIWRYAKRHDCQYVLLDQDADVDPDLPSYAW